VNEFDGLDLRCDPDEPCRYPNGNVYLQIFYPTAIESYDRNALLTGMFVLVSLLAAWLALVWRSRSLR